MQLDVVQEIHEYLVEYFQDSEDPVSPPGIKNIEMLESACARPFATVGGTDAYPGEFDKAAALFHGIISNHSFHNGNKRAALLSALYFLGENNYWVDRCDDAEMFEFTRQVAAHEICDDRKDEIAEIKKWFESNSRRVIKGDRRLSFNGLRDVLARFGFELREVGAMAEITRDGQSIQKILKKGKQGMEEYDSVYISDLRKRLGLTVENGIDSARFYGLKGITEDLNEYMRLRNDVFHWLAKI